MLAFLLGIAELMTRHYSRKQWPLREELTPGAHNVILQALVLREKIPHSTTLHIKLGLAKQLVKALKSDSEAFKHVQAMFPKLSQAKVKGGIFTGPQIRQIAWLQGIRSKVTALERDAWQSFRNVVHGFLGRNKADNYEDLV